MNKQEIFTKVKNHLLTQNKRSTGRIDEDNPDFCKYRGEGGLMCAVGCLILDELYSPAIEGRVSYSLPLEIIEFLGGPSVSR